MSDRVPPSPCQTSDPFGLGYALKDKLLPDLAPVQEQDEGGACTQIVHPIAIACLALAALIRGEKVKSDFQ